MGLRPWVFMAKEVIFWPCKACKPLTTWTWCKSMRNSTSGCAAQNSVCLTRMLGTGSQWCVHYYFIESVADICPVIVEFTLGKHVLEECFTSVRYLSLDECSALLVCPTVILAVDFILNILCFFVCFHSSSIYPWEANPASLCLIYLNYFNSPSPNFISCLHELGLLSSYLILFSFPVNFP